MLGGLSWTELVRLKSWRERSEQTSMESCKSTWRAVRFLSRRDGQKREEGLWLQLSRAYKEWFSSLVLFLLAGVGAIVGDKTFYKIYTHSRRSVWMHMAFLAFIWKRMI